jgi:hypothetical protein
VRQRAQSDAAARDRDAEHLARPQGALAEHDAADCSSSRGTARDQGTARLRGGGADRIGERLKRAMMAVA